MKIGIFDSGRGGTTVMAAIKQLLPSEEYFYLADTEHCPYGDKSDEELYAIVTNNVKQLQDWGAQIIVIACNTATVRCIEKLRRDFPTLQFVGTEPAIRLATATNAKEILVLATPGTIASERTHELAAQHRQSGQHLTLLPCPGLADTIEHHLNTNPDQIDRKLAELFSDYTTNHTDPDIIVLGCTHYPLITAQLQKYFPTAQFIDGAAGVARRVASIITNNIV